MKATATRGLCGVCNQQVETYARPRAGEDRPRPRSHKDPTAKTTSGYPAMCPGVYQQVSAP